MLRLTYFLMVLALRGGADTEPTDRLEVVSWWVSPSEHPAFEVLLNAFRAGNPDVEVVDGAIAGGGGSNVQVALAARLQAGDPPDVWQTFLGSSLRAWVDAGRIVDVSGVFESSGCRTVTAAPAPKAAAVRPAARPRRSGNHFSALPMLMLYTIPEPQPASTPTTNPATARAKRIAITAAPRRAARTRSGSRA